MIKIIKLIATLLILLNLTNYVFAESSFYAEGKKKYNEKKYEESKFLFQRSIVFNPKKSKSYLYLAKIYKFEDNIKEEEKNISEGNLEVNDPEAIYILMEIELKKSNYSKVKELALRD